MYRSLCYMEVVMMTFTLLEIDEMTMAFEQTHWHTHHGKWKISKKKVVQ